MKVKGSVAGISKEEKSTKYQPFDTWY